jgi:hypothetical protein
MSLRVYLETVTEGEVKVEPSPTTTTGEGRVKPGRTGPPTPEEVTTGEVTKVRAGAGTGTCAVTTVGARAARE